MASRIIPTTNWNRDRFIFAIAGVDWAILTDTSWAYVLGITDTNPINTIWS